MRDDADERADAAIIRRTLMLRYAADADEHEDELPR